MQKNTLRSLSLSALPGRKAGRQWACQEKKVSNGKLRKKTLSLFYASGMKSSGRCVVTEWWGRIWITLISLMKRRWKGWRYGGEQENVVSKEVLSIYPLEDGLSYFIPFCSMLFCRQCWISSATWTQIRNDKCEQLQHLNIEIVFSASVWYCRFCRLLPGPRVPSSAGEISINQIAT